jgi:PIN domain nuclease of toxin-antitoxin system
MPTICDTHVLLFWADQPQRLSATARDTLERGLTASDLACSDISLWEIAMLYARGRLNNRVDVTPGDYIRDILAALAVTVLPITAEIAELSQRAVFAHGDPADRLIGATALAHRAPLVTADKKLRSVSGLRCIW